jgi:hypothetical protein
MSTVAYWWPFVLVVPGWFVLIGVYIYQLWLFRPPWRVNG